MRPPPAQDRPPRDHGPHTLKVWEGTVVGLYGDDVFVELGPRMQGVISRRRFEREPGVGDSYHFTLLGQEESLWALSLSQTKALASWEGMEDGSQVQARVVRCKPGGLELKVGPLHAFMPRSHCGLPRGKQPAILVGKTITCEVIQVDPERQRVLLSRKLVLQRERESERQRQVGALQVGQVVSGRVTRIEPYGVFVRFGRGMEGLVHVSNLSWDRVEDPGELVKKGEQLDAVVLYVRNRGKRIGLGLKQMGDDPWLDFARRHRIGQVVEGSVARVVEYGAFVSLSLGIEGLLHRSETGSAPDGRMGAILAPGQKLSVRILELDGERQRLSLSLLHPDGARIAPEEAAGARLFADRDPDEQEGDLKANLGRLLRGALEEDEPRPPGPS